MTVVVVNAWWAVFRGYAHARSIWRVQRRGMHSVNTASLGVAELSCGEEEVGS